MVIQNFKCLLCNCLSNVLLTCFTYYLPAFSVYIMKNKIRNVSLQTFSINWYGFLHFCNTLDCKNVYITGNTILNLNKANEAT